MDEQRRIGWEKWVDPYGTDIHDAEWPGAIGTQDTDLLINARLAGCETPYEVEDYVKEHADLDFAEIHRTRQEQARKANIRMITTPMGIIPLTENSNASKIFNFWVAHTNFRLTQDTCHIIDHTPGVESFCIYTPYRWRISIGKAFDTAEVKVLVANNLSALPANEGEFKPKDGEKDS